MKKEKNKKFPLFWVIYGGITIAALLAVGLFLNWLYNFLDAYESTRPIHEAEKAVEKAFLPGNKEVLKSHLTNEVGNGVETLDEMLAVFYDSVEGKKLTVGRYYGKYTDEKPQYLVSADGEQVAYFALKKTKRYNEDFDFYLWEVESITLIGKGRYSYAVTIPDTMTLYVNDKEISKSQASGHKESDCKVGYSEYSGAGFYTEPEIKVLDRAGQEVVLLKDETTGAYYYLLHYAYAPYNTKVSIGGISLSEEDVMESNIDSGVDFFMIKEVIKTYSEYNSLTDAVVYPYFVKYFIDFYVKENECSWTDRLCGESRASYNSETRTFSAGLVNDEEGKEALVEIARAFLENYALFISGDQDAGTIAAYFPTGNKSNYYKKVAKVDNNWFISHTEVMFENHDLKEFFKYDENYAYVHLYLDQKILLTSTGKWYTYQIDLPLWLVKIDGNWYVGGIDFASFNHDIN